MKKPVLIVAVVFGIIAIIAAAYFLLFSKSKSKDIGKTNNKRQIINALPFKDRPFVALFPHSTNKLITLMVDKKPQNDMTIDIEYLSGNALKGGRTTLTSSDSSPYTQAFLLGSCSAGGKCSFDTDITTGTVKSKLEIGEELHLLKSNYIFINGDSSTSDQKLKFSPLGKTKAQMILIQTHGYQGTLEQEVASEPVAITSTIADLVNGTLTIHSPEASKAVIFDGTSYQPLPSKKVGDSLVIDLKQKPRGINVTIIRDDLKGAEEQDTLYILGPIVPIK